MNLFSDRSIVLLPAIVLISAGIPSSIAWMSVRFMRDSGD